MWRFFTISDNMKFSEVSAREPEDGFGAEIVRGTHACHLSPANWIWRIYHS